MPRQRKTDRGPPKDTVVSAVPFTPDAVCALLHDKVVKEKKVKAAILPDNPAIAAQVYILNILQWKARNAGAEPQGPVAKTKPWLSWPTTGMMPNVQLGRIEPVGLERFPMLDPVPAIDLAARVRAMELMRKSYDQERGPLLERSIRRWKDYAPDLVEIFCSELPNLGEAAAYRFIKWTALEITGEKTTEGAVKSELNRERWRDRDDKRQVLLLPEHRLIDVSSHSRLQPRFGGKPPASRK